MPEDESVRTSWVLIFVLLVLGLGVGAVFGVGGSEIIPTAIPVLT